ncbi:MAG TPA: paraquat-inducible protein A [Lacunisphaera sp.]|nr:paraquat-inducible protein A [Lacunisphaera sp.]
MNPSPRPDHRPPSAARFDIPLACAVAALLLYLAALCLPLATAARFGESRTGYLLSGIIQLWRDGDWHLALLVLGCGVVAPLLMLAALGVLLFSARNQRPRPALRGWLRLAVRLEQWSMPEVQVLGIFVAFTKLSVLVTTRLEAGLWCYGAAAFFTLLAWRKFDAAAVAAALFPARPEAAR